MRLVDFLARLECPRQHGDSWRARCPAHQDRNPSLSITERDRRILINCHAGCTPQAVVASLGLTLGDLYTGALPSRKIVATYDYTDKTGQLLYQVVRLEQKSFRQRRPGSNGGWIWNLNGVQQVLYRLPEILGADFVLIVEGEKDAEAGRLLGFTATCNSGGAGKWRCEYSEVLRAKQVAIISDADKPGREHAQNVAASLAESVRSVKVLELPDAKDLADWTERGGTREELFRLIQQAPEWQPPAEKREREGAGKARTDALPHDRSESHATRLVKLVEQMIARRDVELFHTPGGKPFAKLRVNGHWETWALRSTGFDTWLARLSFEMIGKAASRECVKSVLAVLTGKALFAGSEVATYVRVAGHEDCIYVDLCDASWRAVQITSTGWGIASDPPVRFRRPRGMLPLPEPISGGAPQELLKFVNIKDRASQVLFLSWIVAAFRPRGPCPILAVHGGQGSAKTTCQVVARNVIDPSEVPLRTGPRDERDLMIAANNAHVIGYDNLSSIPPWLSDAVCRVASGGGLGTRQLYTDEEETIFCVQRPILFNGIEELMSRGDLLDRLLIIHQPPIPEGERCPEEKFWQAFEEARPRILGAILTAVAAALRNVASVTLATLPRMADFALWSVAAEQALGFRRGEFMAAYSENRAEANRVAVESSPLALEILTLLGESAGSWRGTASELLEELNGRLAPGVYRDHAWPKTAKATANALARIVPNLCALGVTVQRLPREPGTGRRPYEIRNRPSQSSHSATIKRLQRLSCDVRGAGAGGEATVVSPPNPSVLNAIDTRDDRDGQTLSVLDELDLTSGEENAFEEGEL